MARKASSWTGRGRHSCAASGRLPDWEPKERRIVVKRDQLRSLESYAGTLLREVAHAPSGTADISAGFEDALTAELGDVAAASMGKG